MKSIFDSSTREELEKRVNSLSTQSSAQWGKMDVFQMIRHCTLCDEMFTGKIKIKRVFIGRLIGRMILKKALQEDRPFGRNAPTSPLLKTGPGGDDIEPLKKEWIRSIEKFSNYNNPDFTHPFFGPLTREQVGMFAYKHADHHLTQFGA